jgi:hypothetical protein
LLALLLALRLLGSSGYMPAVDGGGLTIIVCPDADLSAPLAMGIAHHHHGHGNADHHICPYAAAAALGAVGPEWTPLVVLLSFAVALLLGRTFLFVERQSTRERPPARGPPIGA